MSEKEYTTRRAQRQARRVERQREEERLREAKKRRTIWISTVGGLVVVIVITAIILNYLNINILATISRSNSNNAAITSDNPAYPVVNDIACQTNERLDYHIHAHLSIYVNGQTVSLPANIGIASDKSCIYWLHTHDNTGVIHIESPTKKTYSLGTFFQMWYDHFSQLGYPSQLSTTAGWQVYVDGEPYTGDFHTIQLLQHKLITLAYNSPGITPDKPGSYNWPKGT